MNNEEFKKTTKALIKKQRPETPDAQIDLHHDSSYYWGPENFAQAADWISKTISIVREPEKFHNGDIFVNFFGIIDDTELPKFLSGKTTTLFTLLDIKETDVPAFIASNKDPETRDYFERVWEAKGLIDLILKDFSDDEKFLLRFVRHRHCHVTLSNFAVRIAGTGDDAKFKTANWERLVQLSKVTTIAALRKSLIVKLKVHETNLERLRARIAPEPGDRLFQE